MIIELDGNPPGLGALLENGGLPASDIDTINWQVLLGWMDGEVLAGVGGLERCGKELLLRSVAVLRGYRGRGIAARLVDELEARADSDGFGGIYLLTLDAEGYFQNKLGYEVMERDAAPAGIRGSSQYSGVCPASATLMHKQLNF